MLSKKEMGKRISHARELMSNKIGKKYTGQMLAEALGVSRGFIGDIENGRTPVPDYLANKIIKVLELPDDYFSESKDNPSSMPQEPFNGYYHITKKAQEQGISPEDLQLALDFFIRARKLDEEEAKKRQ